MTAVPYLVHADLDKPHRCPSCHRSGASEVTNWKVKVWRAYTCPHCGQRFARRLGLPWHPDGWSYRCSTRIEIGWLRFVARPAERAYWWLRGDRG